MEFTREKSYPKWNYRVVTTVPGIPNWEVEFKDFLIEFNQGSKLCYLSKKYSGDYTVHVTSEKYNWNKTKYTDKELFKELLIPNIKILKEEEQDLFVSLLREIILNETEKNVLSSINNSIFTSPLKVVLYTLWHRAIIEERLYSSPRFAGNKQVIGLCIAIINKVQEKRFSSDELITLSPYNVNVTLKFPEAYDWYKL